MASIQIKNGNESVFPISGVQAAWLTGTTPSDSSDLRVDLPSSFTASNSALGECCVFYGGVWRNIYSMLNECDGYRCKFDIRTYEGRSILNVYPIGNSAKNVPFRALIFKIN